MPHPHVTIRHARQALHLLISGALRDIEAEYSSDDDIARMTATVHLFDGLADQMDQWEIEACRARKLEALHYTLEEMLSEKHDDQLAGATPLRLMSDADIARTLLAKHDLMP